MVRSYTTEPVDPAVLDRVLTNATRAPSAGFSQGWGFLVLDTADDVRRYWTATADAIDEPDQWLRGMMRAPVVVVPCSSKAAYLRRYAEPDKGWTDMDEARWPVPFWHMDAAMASLLILQTAVDAGLGACFFGIPPQRVAGAPRGVRDPRCLRPGGGDHRGSSRRRARARPGRPAAGRARPSRRSCTAATGATTGAIRGDMPPDNRIPAAGATRRGTTSSRIRDERASGLAGFLGGTFHPSWGEIKAKGDRTWLSWD